MYILYLLYFHHLHFLLDATLVLSRSQTLPQRSILLFPRPPLPLNFGFQKVYHVSSPLDLSLFTWHCVGWWRRPALPGGVHPLLGLAVLLPVDGLSLPFFTRTFRLHPPVDYHNVVRPVLSKGTRLELNETFKPDKDIDIFYVDHF